MWGHFRKQAEGVLRVDKSGIDDFRVCRGKGEGCGWCLWMHLHCAARSTMDLKIVPHSSMVMENFGEVLEKRGTCSPYVVHLRAQLTKLDELTWSKKNSRWAFAACDVHGSGCRRATSRGGGNGKCELQVCVCVTCEPGWAVW